MSNDCELDFNWNTTCSILQHVQEHVYINATDRPKEKQT